MPCIPQTWGSILCNVTVEGILDHTALWVSMVETFVDGNVSYPWKPETPLVVEPQIWPKDIRSLYNIPLKSETNTSNIVSIASFGGESYTQPDLDHFCDLAGIPRRTLDKVWSNLNRSSPEGTLDVQTVVGLVGDARIWFIGQPNNTDFILEWAIQVLDMGADGPLVHSISYGLDEQDVDKSFGVQYMERSNIELAKIALLGKTVVIASGDQGAPGRDDSCKPLHATWPGSSPYATSVGATRVSRAKYPECWHGNAPFPSKCYDIGEIAIATNYGCFWTTGGGFSNNSIAPTWQRTAIKKYLNSGAPIPPESVFNISGRAYPDVAALGHNIALWMGKGINLEDGTSASTPIFASIVTLLNNIRLNHGLPPMGFMNPWLYEVGAKYPEAFSDMITGDNTCSGPDDCCTSGFFCKLGWDPVTGFGTPNYPVLADLVLKVKL
jgi:tripeptidyl-peptidase-1